MKRTTVAGFVALALTLGLTACGSDDNTDSGAAGTESPSGDTSAPDETTAPGDTTAPGGDGGSGGNPMTSEECRAIYGQIIGAMAAVMAPDSEVDVEKVFGEAKDKVPDELQDDVEVLANAMADMAQKMKDNPNNPAIMAEVGQMMSTPEVQEASQNVSEYFDATCPQ